MAVESLRVCWPGGKEDSCGVDTDTSLGSKEEGRTTPSGLEAPLSRKPQPGPGTGESSDGHGRRKDPAQ